MNDWPHILVSLAGLVVAIGLLLEAFRLRKVALGGVIAEKIRFVMLAILCLGAAAIAEWTANFVQGVTLRQTQLGADVLVVAAMTLLATYFFSVRTAMQRYITAMTQTQQIATDVAPTPAHEEDPKDAPLA